MESNDKLEKHFRITETQKDALKRLNIFTLEDLLLFFPVRYTDISVIKNIADIADGDIATLYGKITGLKTKKSFRGKMPMGEATLEDLTGKIKLVWFNQAYIAKMYHEGQSVILTGKISKNKYGLTMTNGEVKKGGDLPIDSHTSLFQKVGGDAPLGTFFPVYRETKGITSKWIYHTISKIISNGIHEKLVDAIPTHILTKYSLPKLQTALVWIHLPQKESDTISARKRFAFEEVFYIQLDRARERLAYTEKQAYEVLVDTDDINTFIKRFPFTTTNGQQKAIKDILNDFQKPHPMSRLLEGDVGSGKTAVAATATYAVIKNRPRKQNFGALQVAYMAPTEILATQHFESFIEYFEHTGIQIGLMTSSGCRKFPSKVYGKKWTDISRTQLLKWVANGEIPILIGTHSLIQKSVKFKDLALVIIDEQHRFGVKQRSSLAKKENFAPHFLSMTATPIPRTLALTVYGDLDLTLLEQMPHGRKQIITKIIPPDKRDEVYDEIKAEMKNGRQLYVICPRIDEPDPDKELSVQAKSVEAESVRLKRDIFKDAIIASLHSKVKKEAKEKVMKDFLEHKADILVATSVVEVGVNVPNATIIIIEGAERFGLAQLHQLRGRVVRSNHQAYCYIFAESGSQKTIDRLKAFQNAKNGFELAELDMQLRGAGELTGGKQWGLSDIGMEAIKNLKMVEAARSEAISLVQKNETVNYPELVAKVANRIQINHFE